MGPLESIDDPLLKELLAAFKEDSHRLADDILRGVWMQMAIALVALVLAVSSTIRLLVFTFVELEGGRPFIRGPPAIFSADIALTLVLFILSIISLYSYLTLRRRYSRLSILAERLSR